MKIISAVLKTPDCTATFLLRILLGIVIFPHGAQKALGWFGGYGFNESMSFLSGNLHIPAIFAILAVAAEFAGSIGLILGLFTRVAAFGIGVTMTVAMLMVHLPNGFFMNWAGSQKGEGYEFHLLAIGISLFLMIRGGGKWALDSITDEAIPSGRPATV